MSFDWDDVRIFLAVARTRTIRGAAQSLGVTHATVSRRLHGFEGRLGARLFERLPSGHELTQVGEDVISTAQIIEQQMAELDRQAFGTDHRLSGHVSITMPEGLALTVMAPHLAAFQDAHPDLVVEMITTDRAASLVRREFDVALRLTNTPPESALGRRITNCPLAGYASHAYLKAPPVTHKWVALTYEPAHAPRLGANTVMVADTASIGQAAIRAGAGIGMLPCYMGDNDPALVRVPQLATPQPDLDLWLLIHADLRHTRKVAALRDAVQEALLSSCALLEGASSART